MSAIDFVDHAMVRLGPPPGDQEKRDAALFTASRATDAADLRELLAMLGLTGARPRPAAPPRTGRSAGHARRTVGKGRP